ncbi:MAG: hypothetical protein V9G20_13250 [Candidatus Promineifilaceae bacterium]
MNLVLFWLYPPTYLSQGYISTSQLTELRRQGDAVFWQRRGSREGMAAMRPRAGLLAG